MYRRLIWIFLLTAALVGMPTAAQDGLNLPTALYALTAEGRVERYGLGIEGVRTLTPEDEFVVDFGVAPDDTWLAYRTESALMLRNIYSEESHPLDGVLAGVPPVRGQGDTVAWSPAGDAVAVTTETGGRVYFNAEANPEAEDLYTAVDLAEAPFVELLWSPDGRYLAAGADQHVWWLYRRESSAMILTSAITSSFGLAWYNNTSVVFAPAEGGLRLMDLAAANAQSTLLDDTWNYYQPYQRSDGTLLVFGRQKEDPAVPEGFARLVGLAAGEPRIDNIGEVAVDLTGLRWAPGGELMLALQGGALALASPVNGQSFPLPLASVAAYTWGPLPVPQVDGVNLPAPGFFLAADDTGVTQVWRLPADGTAPEAVTTEETGVTAFAVSEDGTQVVYSAGSRLAMQRVNGAAPVELAALSGEIEAYPVFSPDGQQIAYTDSGIWVVSAGGGDPQQIIADDETEGFARRFSQPQFAPNINALLVRVQREDVNVPAVLDPNTGEVLEIALEQNAVWLRDGRIILFGLADGQRPGGLSIAGTGSLTQPAQFLPDILSVAAVQEISANQLRLVLPERTVGPQVLRTASMDVTTGQLSPAPTGGFMVSPALSPDGTFAAGYVYQSGEEGRGPLTFRNLQTDEQVKLAQPAEVWDFVWAQP